MNVYRLCTDTTSIFLLNRLTERQLPESYRQTDRQTYPQTDCLVRKCKSADGYKLRYFMEYGMHATSRQLGFEIRLSSRFSRSCKAERDWEARMQQEREEESKKQMRVKVAASLQTSECIGIKIISSICCNDFHYDCSVMLTRKIPFGNCQLEKISGDVISIRVWKRKTLGRQMHDANRPRLLHILINCFIQSRHLLRKYLRIYQDILFSD